MNKRIFDAHCDTVGRIVDDGVDVAVRSEAGHLDMPRLREAGVGCQVFACYVTDAEARCTQPSSRLRQLLTAVQALGSKRGVVIPRTPAELASLATSGDEVGVLLAIENGAALGGDPGVLADLRAEGVRYITLCWDDNDLGGGSFGDGRGLSQRGRAVVREMERQRILIDLSHASDATFKDVLAITSGPVIASHSNARALTSTPRNLTDEQAREIAARGGVIGVTFVSGFLSEQAWQREAPLLARLRRLAREPVQSEEEDQRKNEALAALDHELGRLPGAPLTAIADHVEHWVAVAGIDAVGFGSDFDGFTRGPTDLSDCRGFLAILAQLRERGFSDSDLDKLCFDNWARVFASTF